MSNLDAVGLFENEKAANIEAMSRDPELKKITREFLMKSAAYKYSYNFSWMGRPVIQYPQDLLALQEIIWEVKPRLIVETGIAHGGSLVFYASMLELLGGGGQVVGVDVEIRPHNRVEIEKHPMKKRITLIEGSSIDENVVQQVKAIAAGKTPVLVVLDSNHTHDHVLKELELYSPLVTKGSYLTVLDTLIEDLPANFYSDRPWGIGNNPKTAVHAFLKKNGRFQIDQEIENKLILTVAADGYLKCIK